MEKDILNSLISKFDKEKIEGLEDTESMYVFNALKDLELYQKIGTIEEFITYKNICKALNKQLNQNSGGSHGGIL